MWIMCIQNFTLVYYQKIEQINTLGYKLISIKINSD